MIFANKISIFIKEVYIQLRKINWLKRQEVIRHTLIVLIITLITAFFLGGLDFLFSEVLKLIVF